MVFFGALLGVDQDASGVPDVRVLQRRESACTGKRLTRREFVLGLIETALNEAESQTAEDSQTQGQEEQQDATVEEAQPA